MPFAIIRKLWSVSREASETLRELCTVSGKPFVVLRKVCTVFRKPFATLRKVHSGSQKSFATILDFRDSMENYFPTFASFKNFIENMDGKKQKESNRACQEISKNFDYNDLLEFALFFDKIISGEKVLKSIVYEISLVTLMAQKGGIMILVSWGFKTTIKGKKIFGINAQMMRSIEKGG